MKSNRDRIKLLKTKIDQLAIEIENKGLQDRYIKLVEDINKGKYSPSIIDEDEWDVMLPKERDKFILSFYHTLRVELLSLKKKMEEPSIQVNINNWLDSPWIQTPVTIAGLIEFGQIIIEIIKASGLFYHEQNGVDDVAI